MSKLIAEFNNYQEKNYFIDNFHLLKITNYDNIVSFKELGLYIWCEFSTHWQQHVYFQRFIKNNFNCKSLKLYCNYNNETFLSILNRTYDNVERVIYGYYSWNDQSKFVRSNKYELYQYEYSDCFYNGYFTENTAGKIKRTKCSHFSRLWNKLNKIYNDAENNL